MHDWIFSLRISLFDIHGERSFLPDLRPFISAGVHSCRGSVLRLSKEQHGQSEICRVFIDIFINLCSDAAFARSD